MPVEHESIVSATPEVGVYFELSRTHDVEMVCQRRSLALEGLGMASLKLCSPLKAGLIVDWAVVVREAQNLSSEGPFFRSLRAWRQSPEDEDPLIDLTEPRE